MHNYYYVLCIIFNLILPHNPKLLIRKHGYLNDIDSHLWSFTGMTTRGMKMLTLFTIFLRFLNLFLAILNH